MPIYVTLLKNTSQGRRRSRTLETLSKKQRMDRSRWRKDHRRLRSSRALRFSLDHRVSRRERIGSRCCRLRPVGWLSRKRWKPFH